MFLAGFSLSSRSLVTALRVEILARGRGPPTGPAEISSPSRSILIAVQDGFVFPIFKEDLMGGWVTCPDERGATTCWVIATLGHAVLTELFLLTQTLFRELRF